MVNSKHLVSIVLPTFNRCDLLMDSIKSCLNQTYENLELIVVNDGSTDDTGKVVKEISEKDGRLKLIEKKNAND